MRMQSHKSLIREIAPGVIQIGNNPFAPSLSLNELTKKIEAVGQEVLTDGSLNNIKGETLEYQSAQFDIRPVVGDKNVLIEGDIDPIIDQLNDSIKDARELLEQQLSTEAQSRKEKDDIIENSIKLISGVLTEQITENKENLELKIDTDIQNLNLTLSTEIQNESLELNTLVDTTSGDLYQQIQNESLELNALVDTTSGDLYQQIQNESAFISNEINQIEGEITNLESQIQYVNSNITGVTYEQAENLAKKWAIIFG